MDVENDRNLPQQSECSPPHFFLHADLIRSFKTIKTLNQTELINTINHMHFRGIPLNILLQHPVYSNRLLATAYPEPCFGNQLNCRWDESYFKYHLESYTALCLVIMDNSYMIIAPFHLLNLSERGFTLRLPEKSHALNQRLAIRYPCTGVRVELMQSDFIAKGELMDFSSGSYRIKIDLEAVKQNCGYNPHVPASIRLFSHEKIIYADRCNSIRCQNDRDKSLEIVFASQSLYVSRFLVQKIRNPRRQITPALAAVFHHPFFNKKFQREIFDISATGFSICDLPEDEVFMPGMIIPDLNIMLAGTFVANCTVQILHRKMAENKARYGVVILDMDIHSYSRINHILGIHSVPQVSVSMEVEMDALWEFFFQTGFIYPEKYKSCLAYRQPFMETYRKLYQENPEIARHVTLEKNGKIYGHMSMVRAYERTWLVQHHAAKTTENKTAGFAVLRQMVLFLHGMFQLPSAKLDYAICYFRPDNRFPDRVFGGFVRDFNNLQACSLDLFTYLRLPVATPENDLPHQWRLRESTPLDIWELKQFYKHHSGGLMLNVLCSGIDDDGAESLEKIFERLGFLRKSRIYSLINNDKLKAVFVVDQSDLAVNMSDLLNCMKVLIVDPAELPQELLFLSAKKLSKVYDLDKVILLIYPESYIKLNGISANKQYQLCIADMRYWTHFLEYIQNKFRINYN